MELSLERYRHAALQTSKAATAAASNAHNSAAPSGSHHNYHHQQQHHASSTASYQNQAPPLPMPHANTGTGHHSSSGGSGGSGPTYASADAMATDKRLQPRLLLNMFPGSGILKSDRLHLQSVLNGWYGAPKQAWRQIYRASVHGFAAATFHARCDNIAPTFVIVLGSRGEISGGFNDVAWAKTSHKGGYIHSERAFLFALGRAGGGGQTAAAAEGGAGAPVKYDIVKKPYAICYHAE